MTRQEYDRQYYQKNRAKILARKVEHYQENKETLDIQHKEWRDNNKERSNRARRRLVQANKDKYYTQNNIRRSRIRKSEVASELTKFVTAEAHDLRIRRNKTTGIEWHVDHIIPINGENISGLHVWNNLQVIPAVINLRKGNKYEG